MKYFFILLFIVSCGPYHKKGILSKKELRKKTPPSLRIAEEYDKKAEKGTKTYSNPKKAEKARQQQSEKQKKEGDKYLKKKRRKIR